jgi:hypothetical protein
VCCVRTRCHGELVERTQRSIRVLPLPPTLPSGEYHKGETRRAVRRRVGAIPTDAGLYAASQESVLRVWHDRKASVKNEVASAEHRAKAIQQKLDRLDDAFIYKESIDLGAYERQRDRLREELTLTEIDRHGPKVKEFDVEGILNFAERVLPRASDLWIQASLEQQQRLQRLFFPEGVAFSGKLFDRTVVTSSLFEYLRPLDGSNENLVDQTSASWNRIAGWLGRLDALRSAA